MNTVEEEQTGQTNSVEVTVQNSEKSDQDKSACAQEEDEEVSSLTKLPPKKRLRAPTPYSQVSDDKARAQDQNVEEDKPRCSKDVAATSPTEFTQPWSTPSSSPSSSACVFPNPFIARRGIQPKKENPPYDNLFTVWNFATFVLKAETTTTVSLGFKLDLPRDVMPLFEPKNILLEASPFLTLNSDGEVQVTVRNRGKDELVVTEGEPLGYIYFVAAYNIQNFS